jgi:hypothetical protein
MYVSMKLATWEQNLWRGTSLQSFTKFVLLNYFKAHCQTTHLKYVHIYDVKNLQLGVLIIFQQYLPMYICTFQLCIKLLQIDKVSFLNK